jgi:hypothetical protein
MVAASPQKAVSRFACHRSPRLPTRGLHKAPAFPSLFFAEILV